MTAWGKSLLAWRGKASHPQQASPYTIISLAMLYALWQSSRKDLLDLIRPFVLYAVGNTTEINSEIDIALICDYMEREFGYKSIQVAVIKRILDREASSKIQKDYRCIEKKNKQFILIKSLSYLEPIRK